ncbi:MAG: amidohydrolase family protein, partial [Clostridiales bacterium]|nr:amidohydrolase family protein [Clostridiales bacterium]
MKNAKNQDFVLKGNILYSGLDGSLISMDGAYLVCQGGMVAGVYETLPLEYENFIIKDMGKRLIIPGITDIHIHAPQYTFRGLGMDLELIQWLETNTFPEEAKYKEIAYAKKAYEIFVEDLKNSLTTRACVYATVHNEATILLMDLLEKSGLSTYVGRVNMDRNCSEELCEVSSEKSAMETEDWIKTVSGKYTNTKPIITPRFLPSCSDDLMIRLSELSRKYHLPIQSHLSENLEEVKWVQKLLPNSKNYSSAYDEFGMFGEYEPAIMAHCVHCDQDEVELMKKRNVFLAHCPSSNLNLSSGIAPVRKYLEAGL